MKKIVMLALVGVLGMTTANAQTAKKSKTEVKQVQGAEMTFKAETIDYGTIAKNSDGKRDFVFTNTGNTPLIITSAQGSCGCTVPTYPKEPIAPGATAKISVKYATDRVGAFSKTVTLTTNAVKPSTVLTIKGNVLPEEAAATKS
ncbi:DUF1573 domain-containing protein [Flavobacterium ardleyense]|uniref:DUF1573 domain-containing protein n=1 Tax=Flavobacterium ardleyense TaxID=2038737 RepID=UPI00298C928A|nr:DUF1573 domain-containing protein [Flavobacterium ardleyense]